MGNLKEKSTKVIRKIIWNLQGLIGKKETFTFQLTNEADGWIKYPNSPAYIEPRWGYVFSRNGILFEDSLEPNFYHPKANWRIAMPSYLHALRAITGRENVVRFPIVISLRHFWEWNYYHFYLDVLGKLALLNDARLLSDIPIILGRYALELPFVTQIINTKPFRKLNLVIQDNFYIEAERVIYLKTKQRYKKRIDLIMDYMEIPDQLSGCNNRTFLTRSDASRKIINQNEVTEFLNGKGFNTVDTQGMPLKQQIDIFSQTGILVGIHGAGMTNIIFRRNNSLRVLELHSKRLRNMDHEIIGKEYGYLWDTLGGDPLSDNKPLNFYISIEDLSKKVDLLIKPCLRI